MSRARDLADGTFSGAFSADSPTLVVDDTNNRVGIGIAAPDDDLHIKGATPAIKFEDTDGSYGFISANADNLILAADEGNVGGSSIISFKVDGSEKVRIRHTGGITFNGDTDGANALDDYEEGTWTPTLAGAVSYGQQWGSYVKIGSVVHFTVFIVISSGATSNNLRVSLPFASLSGTDRYHAYRGWQNSWSSSGNSVQWLHSAGGSELIAYNLVSSGGVSTLTETAVGTGNFIVTGSYRTS